MRLVRLHLPNADEGKRCVSVCTSSDELDGLMRNRTMATCDAVAQEPNPSEVKHIAPHLLNKARA